MQASRSPGWWSRPAGMREVLALALPMIVSTASWTILNFTDRLFLLKYSPDAMAAALPAAAISFATICFPLGMASYVNTFVAQYFGAGQHDKIGKFVWQAIWIGLATFPLTLLTIPFAESMFVMGGHEPEIAHLEFVYYRAITYGAAAIVISGALSSFFTGRGKMRTVVVVDSSTAALNIALDYAWIFGKWGFPEWGLAGAAWATTISLWIKVAVYFALYLSKRYRIEYRTLADWRFDLHAFARLWKFGSPGGVHFVVEVSGFTIFLFLVGGLGKVELAASGLAFNVNMLAFMPIYGIGIATATLVGQRLGEDRTDLAGRSAWTAFTLSMALMVAVSIVYVVFPDVLLAFHWDGVDGDVDPVLRPLTIALLRFVAFYCLFDAMSVIFSSAIKGAGDTKFVLWTTLISSSLAVVFTWAGLALFDRGIYYSFTVLSAWILGMGMAYMLRFMSGKWKTMRVIEPAPQLEATDDDEPGGSPPREDEEPLREFAAR